MELLDAPPTDRHLGGRELAVRLEAARARMAATLADLDRSLARLEEIRDAVQRGRSERERLHESALARALARLVTQADIEQAKGIIIAQRGCSPEEAFDVLRRASQRTNVPVRVLAADLVRHIAARAHAAS